MQERDIIVDKKEDKRVMNTVVKDINKGSNFFEDLEILWSFSFPSSIVLFFL